MMSEDRGVVRRIAWRQICPWLIIFRSFRLSVSMPVLFLATLGTALTPAGWRMAEILFTEDRVEETSVDSPSQLMVMRLVEGDGAILNSIAESGGDLSGVAGNVLASNVGGVYLQFVDPFFQLISAEGIGPTRAAYYLMGGLWNILVWAFFAGAITRIAAVQLGREERISFGEAVRHAGRNYGWYVLAPLFPMLGILVITIFIALPCLLMQWDWGVLIMAVVWVFVLVGGLTIAALLVGLAFGWPLMWPTISCEERSDAFEAFSHSYSYTFQRPLHYLFFGLITVAFGALCWLLVSAFSTLVLEASYWAASWGAGGQRMADIVNDLSSESTMLFAGSILIQICAILVQTIAVAFNHGFFWCAATAIYLLLRREVDEAELDEVFVEDEEDRYALPPLAPQESGD